MTEALSKIRREDYDSEEEYQKACQEVRDYYYGKY
jgi:hypothetical protein